MLFRMRLTRLVMPVHQNPASTEEEAASGEVFVGKAQKAINKVRQGTLQRYVRVFSLLLLFLQRSRAELAQHAHLGALVAELDRLKLQPPESLGLHCALERVAVALI